MGKRGQNEGTYRRKGRGWQAAVMLGGRRYWLSAPTLQRRGGRCGSSSCATRRGS